MAGWVGTATTAYLVIVTLRTASADDLLLAVTLSVLAVGLLTAHVLREASGGALSAAIAGALATFLGAWALVAWGAQLGSGEDNVAIALALYAALAGVLAAPITRTDLAHHLRGLRPAGRHRCGHVPGRRRDERDGPHRSSAARSAWSRSPSATASCFSWLGAAVLGLATVLRVVLEVQAPELYTLPAAALLVAVGVWRLRTDETRTASPSSAAASRSRWCPSLLLALDEPVSLRGALIAAAGVLVLAVGVQQRLAAPFVLGAVTTGLLALRHLEPYADAVPRWISLGAVGMALLVVGVTWEARRRNLETAGRYLADLR